MNGGVMTANRQGDNHPDAANPLRGEAALVLGGRRIRLRPSFAALVAAEQEAGPLFALIERAGEGRLTVAELSAVLWHCAEPKPETMDRAAFNEALVREGLAQAMPAFRALAVAVLGGCSRAEAAVAS